MPALKINKFQGLKPSGNKYIRDISIASVAVDCDLSNETLRPFRTDKKISDSDGAFLFFDDEVIVSDNCNASCIAVDIDCCHYIASGILDRPSIKKKGGDWLYLALPDDLPAPVATVVGSVDRGHDGNFDMEARAYYYTVVRDGHESMPSEVSDYVVCDNTQGTIISGIPASFDALYGVESIRVYASVTQLDLGAESKDYDGVFLLVDEVSIGVTSVAHTAHHKLSELCVTEEYFPPSKCMHSFVNLDNGQIAGIVGQEVWMCEPSNYHAFPEAYRYGSFSGKPLKLVNASGALYVLTSEYTYVIESETPCKEEGCRSIRKIDTPMPIVSINSASDYNGACIYASRDGLIMAGGSQLKNITSSLYTIDQWQALAPWTMRGVAHNGWYYGTTDIETIRIKLPDSINDDAGYLSNLSFQPSFWAKSDKNRLFFVDSGVFEFNCGMEWKRFKWHSSIVTLPSFMVMSAYKVIHNYSPVDIIINSISRHIGKMNETKYEIVNKTITDQSIHRTKAGISTLSYQIMLESSGEIEEIHLSSSVADLAYIG